MSDEKKPKAEDIDTKHMIAETVSKWKSDSFVEIPMAETFKLPVHEVFIRYITADHKPRLGGILQFIDAQHRYVRIRNPLNNFCFSLQMKDGTRIFTNSKAIVKKARAKKTAEDEEVTRTKKQDELDKRITKAEAVFHELYYDKDYKVGAEKLYKLAKPRGEEIGVRITQLMAREFIRMQPSAQITKPVSHFNSVHDVRPIITKAPMNIVAMDLKMMPDISKKHYLMFIIDAYSRYAWGTCLSSRDTDQIFKGLDRLLTEMQDMDFKPKTILSDNEFQKAFKEHLAESNIKHITSQPAVPQTNALVERLNGTWSRYYERVKIDNKTNGFRWHLWVPTFLEMYNNTPHDAFDGKFTPSDVLHDADLASEAHDIDIQKRTENKNLEAPDIKVGDKVRIPVTKDKIEKKSRQTYSLDVYEVARIIRANPQKSLPARIKLRTEDGEPVSGELPVGAILLVRDEPLADKMRKK